MRAQLGIAAFAAALLAFGLAAPPQPVRADAPEYVLEAVDPPLTPWFGQQVLIQVRVTPIPDADMVLIESSGWPIDPATGIAAKLWTILDESPMNLTFTLMRGSADPLTITITPRRYVMTTTLSGPVNPVGRGDPVYLDLELHPQDGWAVSAGSIYLWAPNGAYWVADVVSGSIAEGHLRLQLSTTPEPGIGYGVRAEFRGDRVVGEVWSNEVTFDVYERMTTVTLTAPASPIEMWQPVTWRVKLDPVPDDGGRVQLYYRNDVGEMRPLDWFTMDWSTGEGWVSRLNAVGTTTLWARFDASFEHSQPRWAQAWSNPATVTVVDCVIDDPEGAPGETSPLTPPGLVVNDWYGPPEANRTASAVVDLKVPGETESSPWAAIRLSNSFHTCGGALRYGRTMPMPGPWTWSVVDATMGGTDADGLKDVFFQYRDRDGRWTHPYPARLALDRTAPQVGAVAASLTAGGVVASRTAPVRLDWSATDASSDLHFDLLHRANGGSWVTAVGSLETPFTTVRAATATPGQYAVRAVDAVGNNSVRRADEPVSLKLVSGSGRRTRISGTWSTTSMSRALGGSVRTSRARGSTIRYRFTGRAVGWIAPVGAGRGAARVFIGGHRVATVDLGRLGSGGRRIVWARTWAHGGTHVIRIKVLGTPGRPRVDVDGFVVLR